MPCIYDSTKPHTPGKCSDGWWADPVTWAKRNPGKSVPAEPEEQFCGNRYILFIEPPSPYQPQLVQLDLPDHALASLFHAAVFLIVFALLLHTLIKTFLPILLHPLRHPNNASTTYRLPTNRP